MGIKLKYQGPTGDSRSWTLREIVQGKPLDRPTHPMVVHFPIAFYTGALVFDVMSHLGRFPWAPLGATWLILGAFAGTALAVPTGLVDRSTMRSGTQTRTVATRHMLIQFSGRRGGSPFLLKIEMMIGSGATGVVAKPPEGR